MHEQCVGSKLCLLHSADGQKRSLLSVGARLAVALVDSAAPAVISRRISRSFSKSSSNVITATSFDECLNKSSERFSWIVVGAVPAITMQWTAETCVSLSAGSCAFTKFVQELKSLVKHLRHRAGQVFVRRMQVAPEGLGVNQLVDGRLISMRARLPVNRWANKKSTMLSPAPRSMSTTCAWS